MITKDETSDLQSQALASLIEAALEVVEAADSGDLNDAHIDHLKHQATRPELRELFKQLRAEG